MDRRPSANLTRHCQQLVTAILLAQFFATCAAAADPTVKITEAISLLTPRAFHESLESIRVEDLKTHVGTLASDALQGRESGSNGGHAASAYLVTELRKRGVIPAGPAGHYLQEFENGSRNVLACLPGSDPLLRDEIVLVCAHFDHVGYGTPRNSRGPIGFIHNGADDNASGTAGLLEVIDALRQLPRSLRRTILFAFWDAEEKGLLGSKHWVAAPTRPLQQIKLVINADMIGRLRPEGVEVTGSRAAHGLRQLVSEANSAWPSPLPSQDIVNSPTNVVPIAATTSNDMSITLAPLAPLDFTWEIRADSDHHPFFAASIPALMLHTGKHDDYHRPSDDADKLNFEGIQKLSRLMFLLAVRAAEEDTLPAFRPESRGETKEHQRLVEQSSPVSASRLGITWNSPLSVQRIVEITEIAPQSPAAVAGLQVRDRITHFANHAVADVEDIRSLVVTADRNVIAIIQRPGQAEPLKISIRLAGEPTRLGLTWRTDNAEPNNVILTNVVPFSPAALAGLKPRDRLRTFGDHAINPDQFTKIATSHPLPVLVTFERNGILATATINPILVQSASSDPLKNNSK